METEYWCRYVYETINYSCLFIPDSWYGTMCFSKQWKHSASAYVSALVSERSYFLKTAVSMASEHNGVGALSERPRGNGV